MSQSQIQEHDAELFSISFDWCLTYRISFGTILSLCESPGSFPVDQIGLGWENASVMESFFFF